MIINDPNAISDGYVYSALQSSTSSRYTIAVFFSQGICLFVYMHFLLSPFKKWRSRNLLTVYRKSELSWPFQWYLWWPSGHYHHFKINTHLCLHIQWHRLTAALLFYQLQVPLLCVEKFFWIFFFIIFLYDWYSL